MIVEPECELIGQNVEEAGLRHLEGLFLVEIDRQGRVLTPVAPDQVIRSGDRRADAWANRRPYWKIGPPRLRRRSCHRQADD